MPKFAIQKIFENAKDIQRNFMFEVTIEGMGAYASVGDDQLTIRARTAVMPGRSNAAMESAFMGMKRYFPGKPEFPHSLAINFEEFEDRVASTALYKWQQDIFDIEDVGASLKSSKGDIVKTINLQLLGFDGENLANNGKIVFYNCWPQAVGDVTLGYAESGSVTYAVTFQYDRWELK